MSNENIKLYLKTLLKQKKIRILITGPALCGKTETILSVLQEIRTYEQNFDYVYLSANELYGNPRISPASIIERHIREDKLLFIDAIETLFPSIDVDYNFLYRLISKKPRLIAACRSSSNVHPFLLRYFQHTLEMIQPPTKENTNLIPKITFEDIGGATRAKELVLMMTSWCVTNSEKVSNWGLTSPSGAILYGPPGTGKTLLAKAAANSCHCRFYSIAIPDLLRCEVGESEKRLTRVFECARADSPSIVFIDEIQALFGRRNERRADSNRLVVHLIAQLDLNAKHGAVFCLAATNALEAVDPALLQPGRFEEIIEISYPSKEDRKSVFGIAMKEIKHENNVEDNLEMLADMTDGFTASDITGVCQKAAITALMNGKEMVCFDDVRNEIQNSIFTRARTGNLPIMERFKYSEKNNLF